MSIPRIDADTIDVWRVSTVGAPTGELWSVLTQEERVRAERFARPEDQARLVVGRATLRQLLGRYLDLAPAEVRFQAGPRGKPELVEGCRQDFEFNVSHSGTVVLIAIARGRAVGVDVEETRGRFDLGELARSCFTEAEQASLDAASPERRVEAFFRHWTAKEAYIKATGDGLSMPLQDFAISADPGAATGVVRAVVGGTLLSRVRWLPMPPQYTGAIAAGSAEWQTRIHDLVW